MSGRALTVAAGQAEAASGDVGVNVSTAVALLTEAVGRGASLLVLPEAFLTGYDEVLFASGDVPDLAELAGLLAPLRDAARAAGAHVVGSTAVRRSPAGPVTMSMVVVRPDGGLLTPYDKQHLDADERRWFAPGDHGASLVVGSHRLALAVCYDSSFPEHARDAADGGATGYLVSAAFFPGAEQRRDTVLAARALDHSMHVVAACATGTTGGRSFIGGSSVWGPEGEPLARLGTEPGVAVATLDPVLLEAARRRRRMATDRRAHLGPRVSVGEDTVVDGFPAWLPPGRKHP